MDSVHFHNSFDASQFMCENIPGSGEFLMQTFIHRKAPILPCVCPLLFSSF